MDFGWTSRGNNQEATVQYHMVIRTAITERTWSPGSGQWSGNRDQLSLFASVQLIIKRCILFDHSFDRELPLRSLPRACLIWARRSGAAMRRRNWRSRSSTSPLRKINPARLSDPISAGVPPASEPITGVPHAIASDITKAQASCHRDGITTTSADRNSFGTSSTWPRNSTLPGRISLASRSNSLL